MVSVVETRRRTLKSWAQCSRFRFQENTRYFTTFILDIRKDGSIFRIALEGSRYTTLVNFNGEPDLYESSSYGPAFVQARDGSFYGTANGGLYNSGAVYCYNAGLSPPSPRITRVQTESGSVGPTVLIIGTHLIGLTGVNFNGVPVTKIVSRGILLRLHRCARRRNNRAVTIATVDGSGATAKEFTVK